MRLAQEPEKIYVSQEDYDKLMHMIANPPSIKQTLKDLMNRKAPWDDNDD
jgi:uncharacterized protein (DUF1778 family)